MGEHFFYIARMKVVCFFFSPESWFLGMNLKKIILSIWDFFMINIQSKVGLKDSQEFIGLKIYISWEVSNVGFEDKEAERAQVFTGSPLPSICLPTAGLLTSEEP